MVKDGVLRVSEFSRSCSSSSTHSAARAHATSTSTPSCLTHAGRDGPVSLRSPLMTFDPVNKPSHYTEGRSTRPSTIEDWGLGFHLGNAVVHQPGWPQGPDKLHQDISKAISISSVPGRHHEEAQRSTWSSSPTRHRLRLVYTRGSSSRPWARSPPSGSCRRRHLRRESPLTFDFEKIRSSLRVMTPVFTFLDGTHARQAEEREAPITG